MTRRRENGGNDIGDDRLFRRVVTARDDNGAAGVLWDAPAENRKDIMGIEIAGLWRCGASDTIPHTDRHADGANAVFNGPLAIGESSCRLFKWPPRWAPAGGIPAGMHATDSIDYITIVSGGIKCFLDGGDVVELGAGASLVQTGTRHSWANDGAE